MIHFHLLIFLFQATPHLTDWISLVMVVVFYYMLGKIFPLKELKLIPIPKNMEGMFIEINLYKKKWLIGNFYNPCKSMICSPPYFE